MGRALILIGGRGSGKTTVGRLLAARLGVSFVDTDDLVQDELGEPIECVFERGDEARFRAIECAVVASLEPREKQIIATGGGVVVAEENRAALRRLGLVVLLQASVETLASRITGSNRPSLTGKPAAEEIGEVLARRRDAYHSTAMAVVDTDGRELEETCDELQQLWSRFENNDLR